MGIDGRSVILRSPVFLDSHLKIREVHLLLKAAIETSPIWHESIAEESLYQAHRSLYQAIGQLLNIDTDNLSSTDRHRLFICTAAIEHGEHLIPGLSILEQLMGYEYDFSEPTESTEIVLSSGDNDADLIAGCHLALGENAIALMQRFSRRKLLKILEQVNNLSNREERLKEEQSKRDNAVIDQNFAEVEQQFAALGVSLNF